MVIGVCTIEINLPGVASLKEKRGRLKSLKSRIHKQFNVSAAEVGLHDVWQSSTIGVALVTTNAGHAENVLQKVVAWIEFNRPDLDVVEHRIEVEHW